MKGESKGDDESKQRNGNDRKNVKEENELKRVTKWISFTKPKIVLGFDQMSANILPSSGASTRGISVCFDKIVGWSLPSIIIDKFNKSRGSIEISVQLSLSLFHFQSGSFFGSTWLGNPVYIDERRGIEQSFIDVDYSEIIYLLTRIADPSCIGVVELVCNEIDTSKSIIAMQYGCGWAMINIFMQPFPADIAEGADNVVSTSVSIFSGSPRDLVLDNDIGTLTTRLKEIPGSKLYFRIYSHRKLTSAARLISENEIIGKFDVIAGLNAKDVTLPDETKLTTISCIGENTLRDGKKGVIVAPAKPSAAIPLELKIENCCISIPDRLAVENRMRQAVLKSLESPKSNEVRISHRSLKIGFHNGHTIIGNEWQAYSLDEDDDNDNLLLTQEVSIDLKGYVPHAYMAIVMLLEYEIGIPTTGSLADTITMLSTTSRPSTRLAVGSALYIPYEDGEILLKNVNKSGGFDVELYITTDPCPLLTSAPVYVDLFMGYGKKIYEEGSEDGKVSEGDEEEFMVSFDLKAHDPKTHREIEDHEEISADAPQTGMPPRRDSERRSSRPKQRPSYRPVDPRDERDIDLSPIVRGQPGMPILALDASHYGTPPAEKISSNLVMSPQFSIPRDKNSLLARSLQSRVSAGPGGGVVDNELLDDHDDRGHIRLAKVGLGLGSGQGYMRSDPAPANNVGHVRDLSRGARTRLSRHGFQDAVSGHVSMPRMLSNDRKSPHTHVDIALEAGDELSINEIKFIFAAYKSGRNGIAITAPKSIYVTYQFFTCSPTRSEVMRLAHSAEGDTKVLTREDASSRDEVTLGIRHCIDCSMSSPSEAEEFTAYLASATLFFDVWDADALIYIGTCAVPLRRLMRQGKSSVKASLECDIINTEILSDYSGGIASTVVYDGDNMSGVIVGAIQIIASNIGFKGQGPHVKLNTDRNVAEDDVPYSKHGSMGMEGLNWRSHGAMLAADVKVTNRPRNVVRARPLTESTPELSEALSSYRHADDEGGLRSLNTIRGGEGLHSLTYDEVVMLFKRFNGPLKGTIQYKGPLMALLDVPTWGVGFKKLMDAFRVCINDGANMEKDILRHVSGDGKLNAADLNEFIRSMFDRASIKHKPEELMVIVRKFIKEDSIAIHPADFIDFCQEDLKRHEWRQVSRRLRRLQEKTDMLGIDISLLLADKDSNGNGFISLGDFRLLLEDLSQHYHLSSKNIDAAVKYFADRAPKGQEPRDPVSLSKVMAFFGKEYTGNAKIRLRSILQNKVNDIFKAFKSHREIHHSSLPLEFIEELFRGFAVYDAFTHDQIKKLLKDADKANKGRLSFHELMAHLDVAHDIKETERKGIVSSSVEEVLRKLVAKNREEGQKISISETFRNFDIDGSGEISAVELEKGLSELAISDAIPNWEDQVPGLFSKLDKDRSGFVSVKEFLLFLGDDKYVDDALQRMTKIIMRAVENKATIEELFEGIDGDKSGEITGEELFTLFSTIEGFKGVTAVDILEVIPQIDTDGNGRISLKEFTNYFRPRIEKAYQNKVVSKFKRVLLKVADKRKIVDIFKHFDKDQSGSVSTTEITKALEMIPNFKDLRHQDAELIVRSMDSNNDGTVNLDEFRKFLMIPSVEMNSKSTVVRAETNHESKEESKEESKQESKDHPVTRSSKSPAANKELFIRHMKRMSTPDGSLAKFLVYLENENDGFIAYSRLLKELRSERVLDDVSEEEVDRLLAPILHDRQINSADLLRLIEGKENKENRVNDHGDDADEEEVGGGGVGDLAEYDFSKDPETRALEKKLRGFGHIMASKGLDVEKLLGAHDPLEKGIIRRTDFINALSQMGLFIIEKGKALDEAAVGEGADPDRRIQIRQIQRLKGSYGDQAERVARKFVMDGASGAKESDFRDHLESMALINWYRQGQKKMLLQKVLSHSLAASIRIYPRFGKALFFEHPVTNPFGHEERFLIEVKDPELRLVTNFDEWLVFRNNCITCTGTLGPDPVETELFDHDGQGNAIVALLPHETLHLPFAFLSLKPLSAADVTYRPAQRRLSAAYESNAESKPEGRGRHDVKGDKSSAPEVEETPGRHAEVRVVSCTHGHVCAVIKVAVCPRPFVLNRTLRFFEPENTIMKRRIRLAENMSKLHAVRGIADSAPKFVHCVENDASSESRVMIEWGDGGSSGALELLLRYRCGPFPDAGSFHLVIYNDPYQCSIYEIWHVVVQTRQNVHLHASIGGSSSVDLVVRGDRFTRRARAFASQATDKLLFHPESTFQLIPGAFNKVSLRYFPKHSGFRRVQVNLVDVDSRELISAWIVSISSSAPPVMREYDFELLEGTDVHKKIVFKNPWNVPRRFLLSSSDETVMRPRVEFLEVASQGNSYLRLWFSGSKQDNGGVSTQDVYLFLNNEDGQNEESFLFKVKYLG